MKNFWNFYQAIPLQLAQTLAIGSFLLVGGAYFNYVDIYWWQALIVLGTCVGLDYLLRTGIDQRQGFPFSALNTGIGICLFLRTEWWPILLFAAVVAIASKYIFRSGKKHFFNPSYTAIFLMIALFANQAYVNHFQWGSDWPVIIPITLAGLWVTYRAGFLDSVLAFWATLLACLWLFVSYSPDDFTRIFITGSFLIMSFHGFTDPATMPQKRAYRLMFAVQIALLFFICRQIINEGYSFFAAYFLVNLFEVFLWRLENKKIKTYNARLLVQGLLTVILFVILATMSLKYYVQANHTWPRLTTNRCVQLVCQWGFTEGWNKPGSWQ